ncbi:hypothetical protein [Pseudactinotalea terrae]|nr:hypothetical protein [Pseudactinotalea terrae]
MTFSATTPKVVVRPSYAEVRAAELAERRLDAVHAQGSLNLLRH